VTALLVCPPVVPAALAAAEPLADVDAAVDAGVLAAALLVDGAAALADAPPLAALDALAPLFVAGVLPQAAMSPSKITNTSARETKCVCASRIQPPHITFQAVAVKLH
jgi:hypothetical protein